MSQSSSQSYGGNVNYADEGNQAAKSNWLLWSLGFLVIAGLIVALVKSKGK